MSNYIISDGSSFLLLNSDFRNDTLLYGFELNAALDGDITIKVI